MQWLGKKRTTAGAWLIIVGALGLQAGCTTTETVSDSYQIEVPDGDNASILDTQLKILEEKAQEFPRRADLQYKIAAIHFQKEDFRNSAKYLQKAIYLDPDRVRYYYDLGRVHLQMGELDEAENGFRNAVAVGGKDRWSGLYAALGYTLCRLKRWHEAKREFETCIRIDDTDPTPYYFLGSIADIQGDSSTAVKHLRTYLEKGGRTFRRRAIQILGFHGVKVDEASLAFSEFETVITGDPRTGRTNLPELGEPKGEKPAGED